MMKRTLLLLALTACGFPNVMFAPKDGSASEDSGDDMLDAAMMPEHVDPPLPDAGDSGKPILGDSGKPCDKDNDTYTADTCSMGNDCDDTDDRAHPGVTDFKYWSATPQSKGDWNCNHVIETEVATVNLKCSNYGSNCGAYAGFDSNPPCGYFANYITCKAGGLLQPCAEASSMMKAQGCK
jgi:hypothetical protein